MLLVINVVSIMLTSMLQGLVRAATAGCCVCNCLVAPAGLLSDSESSICWCIVLGVHGGPVRAFLTKERFCCPWSAIEFAYCSLQALLGDEGFLSPQRLKNYNAMRNNPCSPKAVSTMSAYLHFGQISGQRVALEAQKHRAKYKVQLLAYFGVCACLLSMLGPLQATFEAFAT